MEGCNRREYDGAVHVRGLERWVAEHVPVAWRPGPNGKTRTRRVAIVGAGPAGLSAAYTLLRHGHAAVLYEGERALGGVLRTGIPTFRLPRAVVDREISAIVALGAEVRSGCFVDADGLERLALEHDAVIVATGLRSLRAIEVPGTWMSGIRQGIEFLHQVNLDGGAICRGHAVVLGGGNTAIDCARSALRCGADRVTIAYRRTRAEMPAIPEEIAEAEAEGVRIVYLRQPIAFYGDGAVRGVELGVVEMGEPDSTGRRAPVATDRTQRLDCDEVILALGQSADRSLLPAGWEIRQGGRLWRRGHALDVFAAGDFATGDGTVAHAIGDGRRAAERALAALGEKVEVTERPDRERAVPATDIRFDHFPRVAPSRERTGHPLALARNFAPVNRGIEGPLEAHRCFSCGHCTRCDTCLVYCPEGIVRRREGGAYEVDYTFCKGCGICVSECPREAMEMVPL
jgi:2-oxoacid:acceptor oxidoreductase delta subunit (pyruvate/2-ketoisovalerate family)